VAVVLETHRLVKLTAVPSSQIRVTAAEPGRVEFELDIQKEHTVSYIWYVKSWKKGPNSVSRID
jgi:hypothetical protein